LRNLNLGGCWRLGDDAVEDTIINLKNLVHLNLAMTKISDYALELLGENNKWLNTMNLFGCKNITQPGVIQFCQQCEKLYMVNLRGASDPRITHQDATRIKSAVMQKRRPVQNKRVNGREEEKKEFLGVVRNLDVLYGDESQRENIFE